MENNSTVALKQTETINKLTDQSLDKISQSNIDAIEKITQSTNNAIDKISLLTTEAINTLTPATNEAIANAVKAAVEKISLASIETVSKLSQEPTHGWWEKSFEPKIFWIAFTGLATFAAVIAALSAPFFEKRHKKNVCTNLIEEELKSNYVFIVLMKKNNDDPEKITPPLIADILNIGHMDCFKQEMWDQYKFQFAILNPKLHARYKSINSMIKTYSKKPSENLKIPEYRNPSEDQINNIEEMGQKADKMIRNMGISEIYKAYQELEYLTKDAQ